MIKTNLCELAKQIYEANKAKGFWSDNVSDRNRGELIALVHSELSEALEADRKQLKDDHLPEYDGFDVELVDALIRLFDMFGAYNIPLDEILQKKLQYNAARPYKHGKTY